MNSLEDTQDKTLRIKFFQMRLYLKCTDGLKGEKLTGVYRMCKWESVFFFFFFFGPLFRKSGDQSFILITDAVFTYFSLNFS